ncbi:MAG: hypothetical protein H7282_08070 [Cytophagaceae bacterium]|nr:hypothetical protein [Cytophagaceae bacterium]
MEILMNGVYTAISPAVYIEQHGGGKIQHTTYGHICIKNMTVGVYFASKNWYKPYFNFESIDLRGEITSFKNNSLEFYVFNFDSDENINFYGIISNDKKKLSLKGWHNSTPDEIFIQDDFEWQDLDYLQV